jgi:hypothetical protein
MVILTPAARATQSTDGGKGKKSIRLGPTEREKEEKRREIANEWNRRQAEVNEWLRNATLRGNPYNVRLMDWEEAAAFCVRKGSRLPTVRELALLLNSEGVTERDRNVTPRDVCPDTDWILTEDDQLCHDYRTYRRPSGAEGYYRYWTKSVSLRAQGGPLLFDAQTGGFETAAQLRANFTPYADLNAVRCVEK